MEEVDKFKYLGITISADRRMWEEGTHRLLEAKKLVRSLERLWKESTLYREVKRFFFMKVVIPTKIKF